MIDRRAELGLWLGQLEITLVELGVLNEEGALANNVRSQFPSGVEVALDGLIENPVELAGLLNACRDARDGSPLSPAVMMAAHLMTKEILLALEED
jgi:hypothetical protein